METVYGKRETYRITKFLDKGESFFVLGYGDIDGHEGGESMLSFCLGFLKRTLFEI